MAVISLKRCSSTSISRWLLAVSVALVSGLLCPGTQALADGPPEQPITGECPSLLAKANEGPLCGTLNPHKNEQLTSAFFLFNSGPSCIGGSRFRADAKSGEALEGENLQVYGALEALTPGTEYTYCLVAANLSGEASGQPVRFSTTAVPKLAATTAITSTSATLHGSLEPAGARLAYRFWLSKGSTCAESVGMPPAEGEGMVSAQVEGLTPNTEYAVCLVVTGSEGFASNGEKDWGTAGGGPEHFTTKESLAEAIARKELEQAAKAQAEAMAKAESEHELEVKAEAAAAAKAQEEAAAMARYEEAQAQVAQPTNEAANMPVSVLITKVRVGSGAVTITLKASETGTVTIVGPGLTTTTKRIVEGTNQIRVALTGIGKRERKHHKSIRIAAHLTVPGRHASGSKLVTL